MELPSLMSHLFTIIRLAEFVRETCGNRDESHGFAHMEAVAKNAMIILEHELLTRDDLSTSEMDEIIRNTLIVAWLHDVDDHKYRINGSMESQVRSFIHKLTNDLAKTDWLIKIINGISYSRENRARQNGTPINWEEEFGTTGALIRNVVSDADKLEALGKVGFNRMLEYTKSVHPGITQEELVNEVIIHSRDKLLRLMNEFIVTNTGKKMAKPLHDELVSEINAMSLH